MPIRWVTIALLLGIAIGANADTRKPRGHADRIAKPRPVTFDADAIRTPDQGVLSKGEKGSTVVRAQILLARAHFSCGEIDGSFGTNLQKTVSAFQDDRHLPVSGAVDEATWAALNADTAPVLIDYNISPEDETGPFASIPRTMALQAKLSALGYTSALEELSERFHVAPKLLQALNPAADFNRAGQTIVVPNVLIMPAGLAASVTVSKGESSVRAYDATGKLLAFYMATTGSEHDPLPIGNWQIKGVQRNPSFHYNPALFWDAKSGDEKAVIKPGPNNPVGPVWIDLSKEHYGIHGTPEPSLIAHTQSHGCIRLTNWDALDLASMIKPGLPAVFKE
jgi:lipoprotein-anchoring transpeptidase ErfK/SrfK